MKKALQDAFICACMLTVGFTCLFDETGTPATRIVGHIGGGLWLVLSGGIIGDRLRGRDSVASIPGSLQAPPAEQPETHTSACDQTKKDAQ